MDSNSKKRVVVTGIGPVTSVGVGKKSFRQGLVSGHHPAHPLPESYRQYYQPQTGYYVPSPQVSLSTYGLSEKYHRIMQQESMYAVIGAKLALEDAGYTLTHQGDSFTIADGDSACVIIGIGIGGLAHAFSSYGAHCLTGLQDQATIPPVRYQRMIVPMLMPNAAAAWITIFFGITGGSFSVNASCASGTAAIGRAYERIAYGKNQWALCGGVEALAEESGAILRGFDMLGVLTRAKDGIPQPFSEARSGFLFAEGGGCILVLEELTHALQRKASIYAEIVDYADTSDACNIIQIDKTGTGVKALLKKLSQGIKINYLNTHGTGTELNDATERDAICSVFGEKDNQPFLGATKGLIGHTIGASGAIEAADCLLSISEGSICGNRCDNSFPQLQLHRERRSIDIKYAASVSYGFGGHNCGLAFRKYTGE